MASWQEKEENPERKEVSLELQAIDRAGKYAAMKGNLQNEIQTIFYDTPPGCGKKALGVD